MTFVKHHPAQVNSIFDELFQNFPTAWGKDMNSGFVNPKVNIHETSNAFHLELLAPGLAKEDFKIKVENDLLTLSYEKKASEENKDYKTIRKEFQTVSFKRSFSLDEKINTEGIQAKYEQGILKLLLPKKELVTISAKEISID